MIEALNADNAEMRKLKDLEFEISEHVKVWVA
jgi:hypothetical protein